MNTKRRMLVSIVWILLGIGLIVACAVTQMDSFYSGMGSAFLVVGILQLLRWFKYEKDPAYREKMETEIQDERNRFLASKAWAWAGYWFVMLCAVASILLRIAGQEMLSSCASIALCILLVLYWVNYFFLKRKY